MHTMPLKGMLQPVAAVITSFAMTERRGIHSDLAECGSVLGGLHGRLLPIARLRRG